MNNTITTNINGVEKTFEFHREHPAQPKVEKNEHKIVYVFLNDEVREIDNFILYNIFSKFFEKSGLPTTNNDGSTCFYEMSYEKADFFEDIVQKIIDEYDENIDNISAFCYRAAVQALELLQEASGNIVTNEDVFFAI